ncbi:hypothetical protein Cgig2_012212 [Carnegiea gigantea]|uniref:Uncharacterized protein n=1 Tax=Carnegiea gigantea TaxID=171969 RepID=A0A9Q1KS42_9CARY|nr:hypothetical protein Cgig2_012212 [Carnegiea gigantea]
MEWNLGWLKHFVYTLEMCLLIYDSWVVLSWILHIWLAKNLTESIHLSLVLYTLGGSAKGGIGLVLNDVTEPVSAGSAAKKPDPFAARRSEPPSVKGSVLSEVEWSVKDVDSDSFDAVQRVMLSALSISVMGSSISPNDQCRTRKNLNITHEFLSEYPTSDL